MEDLELENSFFDGGVLSHSEFIDNANLDLNLNSPEVTKRLLNRVTSCRALIENIENMNESRDLAHRVHYTIYANHLIVDVVYAHFINDNVLEVIGRNSNGLVHTNITGKNERSILLEGLATYVINVDHIDSVAVGTFDPDLLNLKEITVNPENQLVKEFTKELEKLRSNRTSGYWRSVIKDFNIFAEVNEINKITNYEFNRTAYKYYNKLWKVYTEVLLELIYAFMQTPNQYIKTGYKRFEGDETPERIPIKIFLDKESVKEAIKKKANPDDNTFSKREKVTIENCFTLGEVKSIFRDLQSTNIDYITKNSTVIEDKFSKFNN